MVDILFVRKAIDRKLKLKQGYYIVTQCKSKVTFKYPIMQVFVFLEKLMISFDFVHHNNLIAYINIIHDSKLSHQIKY